MRNPLRSWRGWHLRGRLRSLRGVPSVVIAVGVLGLAALSLMSSALWTSAAAAQPALTESAATSLAATGGAGGTGNLASPLSATPVPLPVIPLFFDLAVDEARQRLYASELEGSRLFVFSLETRQLLTTIDLGARPRGLDLSPEGDELAVAVSGTAEIVFLDLEALAPTARLTAAGASGFHAPHDVVYGRSGRLYSAGAPGSTGMDYLHVFDTVAKTEVGRSTHPLRMTPRLAMTADKATLYAVESGSPHTITRFDVTTDTPTVSGRDPHGSVRGRAIAVRGDGGQESQVFTAGGQVWSGDLRTLLAIIDVDGTEIEYVPSRERVYVSDGARLNEIDATTYSVLGTRLLTRGTGIGAVRADAAGATLYVGTNLTVDVLDLTQPPSPVVPPPSLVVGGGHVRAASGAPLLHATEAPLEAPESTGRASTTGAVFRESFDGNPGAPEPWRPAHWDVTVYSHAPETWHTLTPAPAMHGDDCAPPPATHHASAYEDAVFLCRDHVMTVIDAGRASQLRGEAAIVLTPNHLIDFSAGEARLRFDLSTLRTSENDWIDLWITPFEDHLQLPGGARRSIVHNGTPPRGVYLWMGGHWTPTPTAEISPHSMFAAQVVGRGRQGPLPHHPSGYETLLGPSAARRETFELRLSRTHIRFGLPNYDFWWIDTEIEPLDWSQGVVQFSHHSVEPYPSASCTFRGRPCTPTTWHWDNVEITPAVPFTLLRADRPFVDATTSLSVTFPAPAPDRAFLRFFGIGHRIEISVDGGLSWRPARPQYDHAIPPLLAGRFTAYWTPVPAGTTTVHLRAQPWTWGTSSFPWLIRALSIWAPPPLFVQLDAGAAA